MEYGKLSLGKGEHNRTRDAAKICEAAEYSRAMTAKTGEYIDQFTTVPDLRTTEEKLSRVPKCCLPGWKQKNEKGRPDISD